MTIGLGTTRVLGVFAFPLKYLPITYIFISLTEIFLFSWKYRHSVLTVTEI